MDTRLYAAAMSGSVDELHHLLELEPLILQNVSLTSGENPLHVAANTGHLHFVKEIIKFQPGFAAETNQNVFTSIHIAAAIGSLDIVKELLKVNSHHCRLPSRDKKTALHYAATKGRIDVIQELVSKCPECVEDLTVRHETAFHLAVSNNQFEAVTVLVESLKQHQKLNILNWIDVQGNTVLHLATFKRQQQVMELLLGLNTITTGVIQVNYTNENGLTALDLLLQLPAEAWDREIEQILRNAGAKRACEFNSQVLTQPITHPGIVANSTTLELSPKWYDRISFYESDWKRVQPEAVRGYLLLIVVLIATATYQSGLSPPGGLWQEDSICTNERTLGRISGNSTLPQHDRNSTCVTQIAGKAILSTTSETAHSFFLFFNSLGFHIAVSMISDLTSGFPMRVPLYICLVSMIVVYNSNMEAITAKDSDATKVIYLATGISISLPFLSLIWRKCFHAIYKKT